MMSNQLEFWLQHQHPTKFLDRVQVAIIDRQNAGFSQRGVRVAKIDKEAIHGRRRSGRNRIAGFWPAPAMPILRFDNGLQARAIDIVSIAISIDGLEQRGIRRNRYEPLWLVEQEKDSGIAPVSRIADRSAMNG
jgi:hypothetical protein